MNLKLYIFKLELFEKRDTMLSIYGLCVSPGNAKGIAHISSPKNPIPTSTENVILILEKLERNILINLPQNIVGIIAEKGNIGSHGAGILRQLGIPCIVRIPNVTNIITNGTEVSILGEKGSVSYINACKSNTDIPSQDVEEVLISYFDISEKTFPLEKIRPINKWYKPRPGRVYQKLRFDIIKDVYSTGAESLYNVPKTFTRQSEDGELEVIGTPDLIDLCRFQLCNPDWLVSKAKEREIAFTSIKRDLSHFIPLVNNSSQENIIFVFLKSIDLYRQLFKYVFLAQVTSDEILDAYLDFLYILTGIKYSKDIFNMKSNYVEKCVNSGIDPGAFQAWSEKTTSPYIWEGTIDYTPFTPDDELLAIIEKHVNRSQLLKDYESFRIIVPLLYQLSEEFFYMSRSINTFLVWSVQNIHSLFCSTLDLTLSLDEFNDMSLNQIKTYISLLKGDNNNE